MSITKIMKRASALVLAAAMAALVSCSSDKNTSENSYSSEKKDKTSQSQGTSDTPDTNDPWAGVQDLKSGPVLYFEDVTVAPGQVAEVQLKVKNAQDKWNACGIHVTYDDVLECQMKDVEQRYVKYKLGDATMYSMASMGMLWASGLPEELANNHRGCLFFTCIFDGDLGADGTIATFYLKVPDDAKSGTEYTTGIYFLSTDMFTDSAQSQALSKYAFTHWQPGKITVK